MNSNERHLANDVFTPTKPARLTFVERDALNDRLIKALHTPGMQIVVYGPSKSDKTTLLLNKLHQNYENHVRTLCVGQMTFEEIMLNAFDQLDVFYDAEKVHSKKGQISSSLSAEYSGIKAQIGSQVSSESQKKQQRLLPPQLTPQTLARFLGETKSCWVPEDFHKIDKSEKTKLAQAMKLFMDMSDDYSELKIIAIGAVDTAREVVEYDLEMSDRVAQIYVPLMKDTEIRKIIEKGEELLNFSLLRVVKNGIVRYSNGLANVCHQLYLNICFTAGIVETLAHHVEISEEELAKAVELYLEDSSDTLKSNFDKGLRQVRKRKFDNGRLILEALSSFDRGEALRYEILERIRKQEPNYPAGNLTNYLNSLQTEKRGALIRYDKYSGRYSFSNPLYQAYAVTYFTQLEKIRREKSKKRRAELIVKLSETSTNTLLQSIMDSLRTALEDIDTASNP